MIYNNYFTQSNKYIQYYIKIIENAKTRIIDSDETHHILPKSIYPEYSNLKNFEWNSVSLTYREHFICHLLLWKHYNTMQYKSESAKMSRAVMFMSKNRKYNSRIFSIIKSKLTYKKREVISISIDELQSKLYELRNINKVAKFYNVDISTITSRVKKYNLIVGKQTITKRTDIQLPKDVLERLLKSHTVDEISQKISISDSTIRNRIKKYNLTIHKSTVVNIDIKWLAVELQTKNIRQLCLENNLNEDVVAKRVKDNNILYPMLNKQECINESDMKKMLDDGVRKTRIAQLMNLPYHKVLYAAKRMKKPF